MLADKPVVVVLVVVFGTFEIILRCCDYYSEKKKIVVVHDCEYYYRFLDLKANSRTRKSFRFYTTTKKIGGTS